MNVRKLRPSILAPATVILMSVAALPASAQSTVYADCTVGVTSAGGPAISCGDVVGGEARARADCAYAPDRYTGWVTAYQSSVGGACVFSTRGAILETRSF